MNKLMIYQDRKTDKTTIFLLHFFLGWSYGSLDKMGIQILFWITFGGLGFWWLIRLFTISEDVKAYNRKIAFQIGLSDEEMMQMGLIY